MRGLALLVYGERLVNFSTLVMKKTWFVMALLAGMTLAVVGCGGGGSSDAAEGRADLSPGQLPAPGILDIEGATILNPLGGEPSVANLRVILLDGGTTALGSLTVDGSFPENEELQIQEASVGIWQSSERVAYHFSPFSIIGGTDGSGALFDSGHGEGGTRFCLSVDASTDDGETITYSGTVESGTIYVCDPDKQIINSIGASELYQTTILFPDCKYTYRTPKPREL